MSIMQETLALLVNPGKPPQRSLCGGSHMYGCTAGFLCSCSKS